MTQNTTMTDKDIAFDMIASSKSAVKTIAKVLTETTNPQLRTTLKNELSAAVNSHHRLSDIAVSKGWYNAYATPQQQLQSELSEINNII